MSDMTRTKSCHHIGHAVAIDADRGHGGRGRVHGVGVHGFCGECPDFSGGIGALQSREIHHRYCGVKTPPLALGLNRPALEMGSTLGRTNGVHRWQTLEITAQGLLTELSAQSLSGAGGRRHGRRHCHVTFFPQKSRVCERSRYWSVAEEWTWSNSSSTICSLANTHAAGNTKAVSVANNNRLGSQRPVSWNNTPVTMGPIPAKR